jgi:hypothetical protein
MTAPWEEKNPKARGLFSPQGTVIALRQAQFSFSSAVALCSLTIFSTGLLVIGGWYMMIRGTRKYCDFG